MELYACLLNSIQCWLSQQHQKTRVEQYCKPNEIFEVKKCQCNQSSQQVQVKCVPEFIKQYLCMLSLIWEVLIFWKLIGSKFQLAKYRINTLLSSDVVSCFPLLPSPGGTDVCRKQEMNDAEVQELQESVGIKMYFYVQGHAICCFLQEIMISCDTLMTFESSVQRKGDVLP